MNYVQQLSKNPNKPFLFSYRRCPYAMRARMALVGSNIDFDIYEISLRNKPREMLRLSSKGTVPVMIINDLILDESLDIMQWACQQPTAARFLMTKEKEIAEINQLVNINDNEFKEKLDFYKYSNRYPSISLERHFRHCLFFLELLESRLKKTQFLLSNNIGYADIAIFPFLRQFANVNYEWFLNSNFRNLIKWLEGLAESNLFKEIMIKPKLRR